MTSDPNHRPSRILLTGRRPGARWLLPLPAFLLLWSLTPRIPAQVASSSLRPDALGRNGMVAAANPLAALAGQKMLIAGGNAFDAIVAAAAALNAVEPYMSGTGGVGYMLIYSAKEDRVRSLIFGGWTPKNFDPKVFRALKTFDDGAGHGTVETVGAASAAVPGNLAGWNRVLEDYGTKSLAEVFAPAIELLETGVPVTEYDQAMWRGARNRVRHFPESRAIYARPDGEPFAIGDIFRNRPLAQTMRRISREGIAVFYSGEIAREMAAAITRDRGFITVEDLASVPGKVQWVDPIQIDYKGYKVYNHPPPGFGVQQMQTLKIMEGFDVVALGHNSSEYLAHLLEAIHVSRDDSDRYVGDPTYVDVPVARLLSDAYIDEKRREVARRVAERKLRSPSGAQHGAPAGPPGWASRTPREEPVDDPRYIYATTSLSAADKWGNAVVITQTLGGGFGSGYVAGASGVVLNNAMEWMVMEPGFANSVAPGKGVGWCIGGMLQIHKDGKPYAIIGSPGSFGILQSVPQVAMNVLDFKMTIQEAIDAPRFRWRDELRSVPAQNIVMETRVPQKVRDQLSAMGYRINASIGEWSMAVGGVQAIIINRETGWIHGGADPRRNGYAMGW